VSTARTATVWFLRYGIAGWAIKSAARRGDVIARASSDPNALDDPVALYDELHAMGPIGGNRLVSASAHHAVVNQVLRDDVFAAEPGSAPTKLLNRIMAAAIDPRALGPVDIPSLLAVQAPQHTRIRTLVSHAFTPRAIAQYAERIEQIAHQLLDTAPATTGRFDLVHDYAALLPITVIAEIMGVPKELRPALLRIGNDAAMTLDPALSWRDFRAADRAIREGNAMLDEHIATLRRAPGDDLLSEMVRAHSDGDRLSDEELRVNTLLLIGAGFETTVNLIGNATALLLAHPDQLGLLRDDPELWPNAVDEVLRYESPVQATVRIPQRDTELAGYPLRAGRPVVCLLGAANRDPAVFSDPHRFDVTRADARSHLAFSAGAHYCLGAQLAKLEARIALRVLFERYPDLALAALPTRRATRILYGYSHLPVSHRQHVSVNSLRTSDTSGSGLQSAN
jgi:cytochrome P450